MQKRAKVRAGLGAFLALGCIGLLGSNAIAKPGDDQQEPSGAYAIDQPSSQQIEDATAMEPLVSALSAATGDDGTPVALIDGRPSGFSGFSVDASSRSLDLYWVGDVASSVEKLIATNPEVKVTVHPATYSLAEMAAARDVITEGIDEALKGAGNLVWVGPDYRGNGIDLGIRRTDPSLTSDQVSALITKLTGMRVNTVAVDEKQGVTTMAGRQADVSPYYGGAGIHVYNAEQTAGGYCSTGASVVGKSTGTAYMTTAFHCRENLGADGVVETPAGASLGTWQNVATQVESDRDTMLIRVRSGATNSDRQYWGAYNSTSSLPVNGTALSPYGETVCTSGANSGAHCGGEVMRKNFTVIYGGVSLLNVVEAVHPTVMMAATGDSGGPVARVLSTGRPLVGFILGAPTTTSSTAACGSVALALPGSECSRTVWYMGGIDNLLDELNVNLK